MNTFWVTGKVSSGESAVEGSNHTPTASPARPVRKAAVVPIMQRPPTPKAITPRPRAESLNPTSSHLPLSRALSPGPKPDKWPQAEQQLLKFSTLTSNAVDHSVPPGGRHRRNTAPAAPAISQLIAQRSPKRLHRKIEQLPPPLPLTHVDSKLWHQNQLMTQPILNLEQVCQMMPTRSAETLEGGAPILGGQVEPESSQQEMEYPTEPANGCLVLPNMSEMNLMHMRGSISIPMSPVPVSRSTAVLQEMEQFAAHAHESARQAKQLADWASSLVLQLKSGQPQPPPTPLSSVGIGTTPSPPRQEPHHTQGTSVDLDENTLEACPIKHKECVHNNSPILTAPPDSPAPLPTSTTHSLNQEHSTGNSVANAKSRECPENQNGKEKCNIM